MNSVPKNAIQFTNQDFALAFGVIQEAIKDLESQEWWHEEHMFSAKGLVSAKPLEVLEDLSKYLKKCAT